MTNFKDKQFKVTEKWFFCFLMIIVLVGGVGFNNIHNSMVPPKTPRHDVQEVIYNVKIVDPYRWLEDGKSKQTRQWIDTQNKYTRQILDSLPNRDQLKKRITELLRIDRVTNPTVRNGRYFFMKRSWASEQPVICLRESLNGDDIILIDPNMLSPDHNVGVDLMDICDDGTLMAYGVRQGGQDEVALNFFDVNLRKDLPDSLPKARYTSISIRPDRSGFYYVRQETNGPRVYYHQLGSASQPDRQIFGENYGSEKLIDAAVSEDGHYLLITVYYGAAAMKSEVYYKDLVKDEPIRTIVNDVNARFEGQIAGDSLFLQTNWNASNSRIIRVDLNNPAQENWSQVIPQTDAVIESFLPAGGKLLVNYTRNAYTKVEMFELNGQNIGSIDLPAIGSVLDINGQFKDKEIFFLFSSFSIPPIIYKYDLSSRKSDIWWQEKIPVKSDTFETKQVWYRSKDGTKVPMFVVHKKGIQLNGENPTLLTGYGGFDMTLRPYFSASTALWIEAGGVFAQPSLRGGGEFGEKWHQAGMLANKQNVFDDFFAAADWLIDHRFTKPEKLAISGGSNGGLLVGAAITQKPRLFGSAICSYPLLDMIRYQKFLVAKFWVPEYGSSDDPQQFKYLYAYSPYHHVQQNTQYPAILFVTGDSDTRVDPLHARKMTALMQSTNSDKPVLLLYDTQMGHSGGQPTNKQIDQMTDQFSFLFWQLKMNVGSRN